MLIEEKRQRIVGGRDSERTIEAKHGENNGIYKTDREFRGNIYVTLREKKIYSK